MNIDTWVACYTCIAAAAGGGYWFGRAAARSKTADEVFVATLLARVDERNRIAEESARRG